MTQPEYTPTDRDVKAFQALYDRAGAQGLGILHTTQGGLNADEARETLERQGGWVDYHRGRVHKVDFSKWPLRLHLYNRDNGAGAGEAILEAAGITNE